MIICPIKHFEFQLRHVIKIDNNDFKNIVYQYI